MRQLAGGAPAVRYFTHPQAFPMLLLPWWLEQSLRGSPDAAFHGDVVYASITGYYFVRMIDDLMDGDDPPASTIPALICLHTEFMRSYQRHFTDGHAFWHDLSAASYAAAETASADAGLIRIDRQTFEATSARKIAGAKIPLAAVCHRYGRADLVPAWSSVVDLLGRWHQMLNDVRGWNGDAQRGTATYFLTEAHRHASSSSSVATWVVAEGLAWAYALLDGWMDELLVAAAGLDCPQLVAYLDARRRALAAEWATLEESLPALSRLAAALR
jgi:hypothetical protein